MTSIIGENSQPFPVTVVFCLALAFFTRPLAAADVPAQAQSKPATSQATTMPASSPAEGSAAKLKVATYNVNYGIRDENSLAAFAKIIRQSGADVVAVQEGNAALQAYLKEQLGKEYRFMYFRTGKAASGFAWLSKKELKQRRELPAKFGYFGTMLAQVSVGKQAVQLVNVHLYPTIPAANAGPVEAMKVFAKGEQIRAKEIEYIVASLPKKLPVIMLGDFNSPTGSFAPGYLVSKGFVDSYGVANAGKDGSDDSTWHWEKDNVPLRFKLDYIFHNAQLQTLGSRVIRAGNSDHYMVLSELEFAKPAKRSATSKATTQLASEPSQSR